MDVALQAGDFSSVKFFGSYLWINNSKAELRGEEAPGGRPG